MVRFVGAVFGVAVTDAQFRARENERLFELLSTLGARLDAADRSEIRGLLSGSAAAQEKLTRIAPNAAGRIEDVVREAFAYAFVYTFVYAFDGSMLSCMAASVAGVLAGLLAGKSLKPQRTVRPAPGNPGRTGAYFAAANRVRPNIPWYQAPVLERAIYPISYRLWAFGSIAKPRAVSA